MARVIREGQAAQKLCIDQRNQALVGELRWISIYAAMNRPTGTLMRLLLSNGATKYIQGQGQQGHRHVSFMDSIRAPAGVIDVAGVVVVVDQE